MEKDSREIEQTNFSQGDSRETDLKFLEELKSPPKEDFIDDILPEKLQQEARDRAKKRPLLQKIVKIIKRSDKAFHELIINSEKLERRVALLINGVLEKFESERTDEERMVSAIFKGKIQNHEPGLKAAFVDIGQCKNAFLHYWDIIPDPNLVDETIEVVRQNQSAKQKNNKISLKDIPNYYQSGTDIMVQITKAQIGTKGPRVTTNISIAGRFIVLMPFSGQCGISRKIEDLKERQRLKRIINTLTLPEGMGIILRTAGEGKKIRYFIRDLHLLLKTWEHINEKMEAHKNPCLLYQEPDIIDRTVRDFLTEDMDRILIDNVEDQERIINSIAEISPRSKSKVGIFQEDIPIFERFNIERQIEQTFMRRVPLPSGGEIVIEENEALTAIDVNTGSHRVESRDGKNFILQANLEAAVEIARQIRLRNIGGLIVIDFIDMKNKKDRLAIYDCMRNEMGRDRDKSHILQISQLGIMQMSRRRQKESTSSGVYCDCPYCYGRGRVKSSRSMSISIQRKLISIIRYKRKKVSEDKKIYIRILLHPTVFERLRTEDETHLVEIENLYNVKLAFRADPMYHIENFKIIDAESGQVLG